jgi:2-C-methyl-D-erythritol 4-phosphate cytidylyltransferase
LKSKWRKMGTIVTSVLIPAAGIGERLGLGPKALLEMEGRPLIAWLADKAGDVFDETIIAVPLGFEKTVAALCPSARIITGGDTRQKSVELLVKEAKGKWLQILDAARPFVSRELMRSVDAAARESGIAGAFLRPDVPVAFLENGYAILDYPPDRVGIFQAPQSFSKSILHQLYDDANREGFNTQSTIQLALKMGRSVRAVPGEKTNIKLTTPEDWKAAQGLKEFLQ